MAFRRVVDAVQMFALAAVLVTVALLVLNDPDEPGPATPSSGIGPADGAALYASLCAGCHGDEGQGGSGPALGGGVVVGRYPDVADEIAIVTAGQSGMPAFGGRLSEAEIAAVVDYTRQQLGS